MSLIDWQKAKINSRAWTEVVWHHSAGPDGDIRDTENIRKYHMSYRIDGNTVTEKEFLYRIDKKDGKLFEWPWKDIAYHFLVERVNFDYQIILGRPLSMVGSHCVGENTKAIGICLIGNFDIKAPNDEHIKKAIEFAKELNEKLGLKPENHHYHNEFANKTCPGSKFPKLEDFRKLMEK